LGFKGFTMKIGELEHIIREYLHYTLTLREKEAVFETFKVRQQMDENPDNIDERLVSCHALANSRRHSRLKKLDQLLS
jgi:hypothetical protein